jgi:ABC-type uncharacterized transport system substrate-binding protein
MMRKIFWSGIILVIILFNTMPLFAHPHVFIDYQANFIFNQKGLSGVKLKWIFDEFYSASLLRDYDQKHDKSLSVSEVKRLQKEAFAAIANYNYFCDLRLNKKVFVIRSITDFNAAVENNRLIYVFFIPCQIIAKQNGLLCGFLIAILQSVSAIAIVLTLNFIIRQSFTATFEDINWALSGVWSKLAIKLLMIEVFLS